MVLEPAKREYRELSRYDIPELIILSPSASTKFPMRLNPFEFPKGLTLSEHISKLCQVFEGAFPIAPPAEGERIINSGISNLESSRYSRLAGSKTKKGIGSLSSLKVTDKLSVSSLISFFGFGTRQA